MRVLILADVSKDGLGLDATAKSVAATSSLGGVTVLCAGAGAALAAEQAAKISGVEKVLVAAGDTLEHMLAEPVSALIVGISQDYDVIAAPSTSDMKNILPRVAAMLDVMILSDVSAIIDETTFERPTYAGNAIQTVKSVDPKKILTIRTASFDMANLQGNAEIEVLDNAPVNNLSVWEADIVEANERPELTSAKIVVSGGRGVGSEDGFKVVEQLADKLGAAVGASRAAVDAGFAANDLQVGQTGKVVAPELYMCVGISGAIQHIAGMKDSKVIVAINKDAEAPIFQYADFGLEADLFEAVPDLMSKL